MFTVGSLFFVRCFLEPRVESFFHGFGGCWEEHFESDELIAAWFFFFGSIPAIPIAIIYLISDPYAVENWGTFALSIMLVIGTYLFVLACYPTYKHNKDHQVCTVLMKWCFGKDANIIYHSQNNWLCGCWIFYWSSLISAIAAGIIFVMKLYARNYYEMYVFSITFLDCLIFTIGSAYFVSGSYPMNNKAIDDALSGDEAENGVKVESVDQSVVAVLGAEGNTDVFNPVRADAV